MTAATTPSPPPHFFDPQVNGYGAIDFQRDDLPEEALHQAAQAWRRDAGSQFLLTLITDDWDRMLRRMRRLRALRDADPFLRDVIPGWHLEGPFLSAQPGFHGAHDPARMRDPSPSDADAARDAAGSDPLLITVAPERPGALAFIERAVRLGIRVSLGHTDAPASRLRDAAAAGACAFTHLANGCPQQLDRHDNIIWRVLDTPDLRVGLIPDGLHVSPSLFRILHRVLPPERIYYTTDAMAAAGAPPGTHTLGHLLLEVGPDGVVRQPGRTNFAGSSLTPSQLAQRAATMLGEAAGGCLPTVLAHGLDGWFPSPKAGVSKATH
ncbi:MAG: N-acetylglucosamine-6-phosphate deacetylase [Verrucomicrobiae bacterium]|nr:N-acetylglucosamine-6-phosphate deacetylase [Verrucomicrobiae bacterium]